MTLSAKILYVDDELPVRTAFVRTLRRVGLDVDVAACADEAIAMLDQRQYNVIASDYRMPDTNGLELIEQMRRIQPDATFMLVSGHCDLEVALQAVNEHGVVHVVTKPWDFDELCRAVETAADQTEARRRCRFAQAALVDASRAASRQATQVEELGNATGLLLTESLLEALDMRMPGARVHSMRVAALACRLGEAVGLDEADVAELHQAALLHDIGKLAAPDTLLRPARPLSAAERRCLRVHVDLGARLLGQVTALAGAEPIIRQHHERWDGTGYPQGLRGDAIDLRARVFAVCNAFDTMLQGEGEQEPKPLDVVLDELRCGAGAQFDPTVVEVFFSVPLERWLALREEAEAEVIGDR